MVLRLLSSQDCKGKEQRDAIRSRKLLEDAFLKASQDKTNLIPVAMVVFPIDSRKVEILLPNHINF